MCLPEAKYRVCGLILLKQYQMPRYDMKGLLTDPDLLSKRLRRYLEQCDSQTLDLMLERRE